MIADGTFERLVPSPTLGTVKAHLDQGTGGGERKAGGIFGRQMERLGKTGCTEDIRMMKTSLKEKKMYFMYLREGVSKRDRERAHVEEGQREREKRAPH